MQRTKSHVLIHATRVKQAPECSTKSDKSAGNDKCMNARKEMDSYESGARTRLKHHLPITSQYRGGGSRVWGKRGCGLAVGRRGEPIWGSHSNFFGRNILLGWHTTQKRQTWVGITRCMLYGLVREKPSPYPDESSREVENNTKTTFVWEWGMAQPT